MACVVWADRPGQALSVLNDLSEQGRRDVVREIMTIASRELVIPSTTNRIEGTTDLSGVYWRRCTYRRDALSDLTPGPDDLDDPHDVDTAANQYVLFYRECGYMDHPSNCRGPCFRVEALLHNTQLGALIVQGV